MKRLILWVPLVVFLVFLVTVAVGLYAPSDRKLQSPMVGKSVPAFSLPPMLPDRPGPDSAASPPGAPRLVHVFASWFFPCTRSKARRVGKACVAPVKTRG